MSVCCVHLHALFRNSFSQLVGEEFLKFFDFSGDTLDMALRRLVRHLTATGEPQDRDQLLSHFAQRYHSCNSHQYTSPGNVCVLFLYLTTYLVLHILMEEWQVTWVLAVWLSGNALASINVVTLRQTRLLPGWVTVCGWVNHLGM